MKKVIYFPKDGEEKCMSESYPIGKKGLAFKGSIQKLEVLVDEGILRKIETELLEFVEGENVMETKYTFEDWTKITQEKVIPLVQAEPAVEETKVSQEDTTNTNVAIAAIAQAEPAVEETKVSQEAVVVIVVEEKKDNKKDSKTSKEKKDNKKDSKTSKEKKESPVKNISTNVAAAQTGSVIEETKVKSIQ